MVNRIKDVSGGIVDWADGTWLQEAADAEIVLDGKNLVHAIKPTNEKAAISAERVQALHFLRYQISSSLKNEYMTERDPKVLWKASHEHFENMETYKKENYKYIGLSNALQQDQGEDEELMQNYLTHPTSSLSKPDANIVSSSHGSMKIKGRHRRRHLRIPPGGEYGYRTRKCYRCGMKGHWSRICSTLKHIVKLYQELNARESSKSKKMETHPSKPEEKKNEAPITIEEKTKGPATEEEAEDMLVDIKPTDTMADILKNLKKAIQEDDDLLGEELEDMHGDSV
ncbi:hypothetical protein PAHAL_9G309700 [Panicum hallii]|uniref:CCHC-type domain-containing protein n=1 Tax=Panicum hallii TaxID=206008 RepID=A0A2T8I341_9POAL|nr:hypothetical protein PAHAL_9G309700 [Panicum hallii]